MLKEQLAGWIDPPTQNRDCSCAYCGNAASFQPHACYKAHGLTFILLRCPTCQSLMADPGTPLAAPKLLLSGEREDVVRKGLKYHFEIGYSASFVVACAISAVSSAADQRSIFVDIGAGFGLGSYFVREILGKDVLAVEPSLAGEFGRELFDLPMERALFEELPDAVHRRMRARPVLINLNSVIEHLPLPYEAIRSIISAQDVDVLAAVVPDGATVDPSEPFVSQMPTIAPGDHLHLPTAEGMSRLLSRVGFPYTHIARLGGLLVAVGAHRKVSSVSPQEIGAQAEALLRRLLLHPLPFVARGAAARLLNEATAAGQQDLQTRMVDLLRTVVDHDAIRRVMYDEDLPYYLPVVGHSLGLAALQKRDLETARQWFSLVNDMGPAFIEQGVIYAANAVEYRWVARLFLVHIDTVKGDTASAKGLLESVLHSSYDSHFGARRAVIDAAQKQLAAFDAMPVMNL